MTEIVQPSLIHSQLVPVGGHVVAALVRQMFLAALTRMFGVSATMMAQASTRLS